MNKIKRLNSYAAHARFLADVGEECVGYIARTEIRTPYSSGPTHCVWRWNDRNIVILETAHRQYDVYAILDGTPFFATEEEFFKSPAWDDSEDAGPGGTRIARQLKAEEEDRLDAKFGEPQ